MTTKVRKTLTLDPGVVNALGGDSAVLSATVNSILEAEVARRQRQTALVEFVTRLEAEFGPANPADVERFKKALT